MSNTSLNYFKARGLAADRLLFTPPAGVPAAGPGMGISWFETDTGDLYEWDGATWTRVGGSTTSHASDHENGGGDEIDVTGLSGVLADPQTPVTHASRHQNGGDDEINVGGLGGVLAEPQIVAVNPAGAIDGDGSAGSPLERHWTP